MNKDSISSQAIYFLEQQTALSKQEAFLFLYRFNSSINTIQHQSSISGESYKKTINNYLPDAFDTMIKNGWLNIKKKGSAKLNIKREIFKLYIGIKTSDVLLFLKEFFNRLEDFEINDFKIPQMTTGLKRCDKIIIYFPCHNSLLKCVEKLKSLRKDYGIQSIPFTESLDDFGFLSKGVDPCCFDNGDLNERESWRSMICKLIANYWFEFNQNKIQEPFRNYLYAQLLSKNINSNIWSPI